ncbi:uncharacterized protein EAF01_012045 [Botrytis porri]|uniref:uncharacterized protein n=1 Tax=Botrytis porri TaxID=87229 RepID=UPI0018FF2D73|nr:uncharacterized protein EAF01_012045 [Botrytis porri]KAF7880197.1 hypothetical protein EAF01_012045 [Botrytis porri]
MSKQTVFVNGHVFGADGQFYDAIIIDDDKIDHVGYEHNNEVQSALHDGAERIDLKNHLVVPSFIDSHTHFLMYGLSLQKLDLGTCETLEEIRAAIRQFGKENPQIPRIQYRGWLQASIEGHPVASMLDDLDPRRIFVESFDLHSTWCNTAALEELPLESMKPVCGKFISCDQDGKPSRLLAESAQMLIVFPHLIREALKLYRETKGLPIHIAAHWRIQYSDDTNRETLSRNIDEAIAIHQEWHPSKFPDFCIVGVKLVCDGVVDGCTAALSQPYTGLVDLTQPFWPTEEINFTVQRAAKAGLQCAIHAIGDQAISQVIDAIASAETAGGRHRIEHLELCSAADSKRLGEIGITASIQSVHSDPALLKAWPSLIDPRLLERAFPYKEFVHSHARIAIGTDAPTAKNLPLPNLYNATTRKSALDPSVTEQPHEQFAHHALTLSEAVTAATTGAAYSRFAETWTGSLKKGLRADFIVVDSQWTPDTLLDGKIYQTWSGGQKISEC